MIAPRLSVLTSTLAVVIGVVRTKWAVVPGRFKLTDEDRHPQAGGQPQRELQPVVRVELQFRQKIGTGNAQDLITVRLNYSWPLLTPFGESSTPHPDSYPRRRRLIVRSMSSSGRSAR